MKTILHAGAVLAMIAAPVAALAGGLHIRLDQVNPAPDQCQLVFVLENGTDTEFDQLQAEVVLLSRETRVLRLSMLDFQSLPANGLRVRSFNFPDLDCADLGRVLFNAMGPCAPLDARACTAALQTGSDTEIEVLQ